PLAGEGGGGVPPRVALLVWKEVSPPAALFQRGDLPRKRGRGGQPPAHPPRRRERGVDPPDAPRALLPNPHTRTEMRVPEPLRPPFRPDWIRTLRTGWFSTWAGARVGDCNMAAIGCTDPSYVDIGTGRAQSEAPRVSVARTGKVIRLFAVVLGA